MRTTQKSFTGGELSPALYARNDLNKYQTGAKLIKNGIIHQEGAVSNRAGLEFIGEIKDSSKKARLIPFAFNTEQTYIIEAGENYFRFIMNGGYIYYPDDYEEAEKAGQIVEIETPYSADEVSMLKYAQSADVLTLCHHNHPQMELSRNSHYDWILDKIDFKPNIEPPTGLTAEWTGGKEKPRDYSYLVTAVTVDGEESKRSETVTAKGEYEASWGVDEYMTISWEAVDGAAEYNIYKSLNGVFAYIGTSQTPDFTDDKIEPDLNSTAPIEKAPFEDENYPSVVNYYQQRKVYANTKKNPQTIYTSQTGTSENFNVSKPLVASDAITMTLAEKEVNEIRHIVAMNDLIVLTSSAEWKVNGSDGTFSASPLPIAKPQSFYGCSHVMPIVSGRMILFVQASGSVLRNLGYEYVSDSYDGTELTLLASHLFKGKQIIDMAYAKEPNRIVWCVMSDGTLNGLTYNPKQDIYGWHRHETKGEFESVASIREGFEDSVYFIVKRTINGQTKRYVERMASRIVFKTTDSIFLDSALKYEGKSVDELSGLEHLEGEKVKVNADGGVYEHTVKNGKIKLHHKASVVSVGLPYSFEFETLNIEGENTIGIKKTINRVFVSVDNSREDFKIIGADGLEFVNIRHIDSINDSTLLRSTIIDASVFSDAVEEATVKLKQDEPLPLTVLALTAVINLDMQENV